MADDFEIRPLEPSALALELGMDYPLFVVWDLQADKRVPFGNYRRHDQAVARIIRMRDRAASRCTGCLNGGCPTCDPEG
ncbi:hypothetical protein ACFRLW_35455 [Streptomyces sp. NPDC056728]